MKISYSFIIQLLSSRLAVGFIAPRHPMETISPTTTALQYDRDFQKLIEKASSTESSYVLGGDFAGLAATFSPADGSLIPVPDYLLSSEENPSPSLWSEWNRPKCLEVLVSEDFPKYPDETCVRSTVTVLPDLTASSLEERSTVKVQDDIDLSTQWGENSDVVALQYSTSEEDVRVETLFGFEGYRLRVILDLIPSETVFAIQTPMVIILERRVNMLSTGGTIATGLDGRTVSILLGENLRSKPTFAEQPPLESSYERNGIQFVGLPANLSIAYGWLSDDTWSLQVGHVNGGRRKVVSREFNVQGNGELVFDVQSWEEDALFETKS